MTETIEPESLTSADSGAQAGGIPSVVRDHVRDLDDTLRLGLFVAVLAIVTCVLAGLVVLCAIRPSLPLYVLGG